MKLSNRINQWIDAILNEDGDMMSEGSIRTLKMIRDEVAKYSPESASPSKPVEEISKSQLDGMRKNMDMALEREKMYEKALRNLCHLKKWKDEHGKDHHYEQFQPEAWSYAFDILKMFDVENSPYSSTPITLNIEEFFDTYTGGNNNCASWTKLAIIEFALSYYNKVGLKIHLSHHPAQGEKDKEIGFEEWTIENGYVSKGNGMWDKIVWEKMLSTFPTEIKTSELYQLYLSTNK